MSDLTRPVIIAREDLYHLTWTSPMVHVAASFGISGTGLAKACRKLEVPHPPRGYWAKVAGGKSPPRTPLPSPAPGVPLQVTIRPSPAAFSQSPHEVFAREAFESALLRQRRICVPTRLARPHAVIAGWLAEKKQRQHRAREERDPRLRELYREPEFMDSERRQHRLLHALFRALEQEGGKVVQSERRELAYERDGERVEFGLREKRRQEKRPLTEQENRWKSAGDKDWRQELVPTGKLVFCFRTCLRDGLKREWLETDASPMETLLPTIAATAVAAIPWLAERRREREEQSRRWQEADQRRREAERACLVNEARWRKLVELAATVHEVDAARAFISRLGDTVTGAGKDAATWIAWAEAELAARDPLARGAGEVFAQLAAAGPPRGG